MRRGAVAVAMAVGLTLLASACGGDGGQAARPRSGGPETVLFESYGFNLIGKLYGKGEVGVVLPPSGWGGGQGSWLDYPAELARAGFMVLTFNNQGQCTLPGSEQCSEGSLTDVHGWVTTADLGAAVDFIQSRGAQDVFLIGARFAGLHVLRLAAKDDFSGIVTLSAGMTIGQFQDFDKNTLVWAEDVTEPHLMIYAEEEAAGGRKLSSSSGGPHELILVAGNAEGAELVAGSSGTEATRESVLTFLQQHPGS
jgi:hypothetical protein